MVKRIDIQEVDLSKCNFEDFEDYNLYIVYSRVGINVKILSKDVSVGVFKDKFYAFKDGDIMFSSLVKSIELVFAFKEYE